MYKFIFTGNLVIIIAICIMYIYTSLSGILVVQMKCIKHAILLMIKIELINRN